MADQNKTKMESVSNIGTTALSQLATLIFHPLGQTKILIQLGYEPVPSKLGRSLLGFGPEKTYYYPNVLKYTSHIWTTDGFLAMYTGVFPRILGSVAGNYVQGSALDWLRNGEKTEENEEEEVTTDVQWIKTLCLKTSQETVAKCCGIIASQPFHVIMVRQIAQFVGGEKIYNGLFPAISEIYRTDGIKGFFAGLIPRLLGEVLQVWCSNLIVGTINRYIISPKEGQSYVPLFVGLAVANFTYPFTLVSNVMAIAGTELIAAQPPTMKPYASWRECWTHLKETDNIKRGSSAFFRVDKFKTKQFAQGGAAITRVTQPRPRGQFS